MELDKNGFRGSKKDKEIASYLYIINIYSKFGCKAAFQSNEDWM